jgi:hypothetical protein
VFIHYYRRFPQNEIFIGHPERTKYVKLFAVEQSRRRRERQKVEERSDEEIYERLLKTFPWANESFCVYERQRRM